MLAVLLAILWLLLALVDDANESHTVSSGVNPLPNAVTLAPGAALYALKLRYALLLVAVEVDVDPGEVVVAADELAAVINV